MKPTGELAALADRVEALTEYDGRLFAEIDCALKYPNLRPAEPDDHPTVKGRAFDPSSIWTPTGWLMSHNYFRSVDDAIALVPDECRWMVNKRFGGGQYLAQVWFSRYYDSVSDMPNAWAATPALALCAAALRARAASCEAGA